MMDFDEIQDANYEELINYFETNKKRPSSKAKDDNEKKLGTWFVDKKNYIKQEHSMKDEEKRKKWEELCEKYKKIL